MNRLFIIFSKSSMRNARALNGTNTHTHNHSHRRFASPYILESLSEIGIFHCLYNNNDIVCDLCIAYGEWLLYRVLHNSRVAAAFFYSIHWMMGLYIQRMVWFRWIPLNGTFNCASNTLGLNRYSTKIRCIGNYVKFVF